MPFASEQVIIGIWIVIVGIVLLTLAAWGLMALRRQAAKWDQKRAASRQQAAAVHRRLLQSEKEFGSDPGDPYSPLIKEGSARVQKGKATLEQVRVQLTQPACASLKTWPVQSLALIIPLILELERRLIWWWHWQSASRQLEHATRSQEAVQGILARLAVIDKQEKRAAAQLRQQAGDLRLALEAHNEGGALAGDLQKLDGASLLLDQVELLLSGAEPARAKVAAAYPLRLNAARLIEDASSSLKHHHHQRTRLTPALVDASKKLDELERIVKAEEENSRRPAPAHRDKIATMRKRILELEATLVRGAYQQVDSGTQALISEIQEVQQTFNKIRKERDKTSGERAQVKDRLGEQRKYIQQVLSAPADPGAGSEVRYELDLAQAWMVRLQDRAAVLDRLLGSESLNDYQKDHSISFLPVDREKEEFKRNRAAYEALRPRFTASLIKELNSLTIDLVADLKDRHLNYQNEAHLQNLVERRNHLEAAWERVSGVTTILESRFKESLADLNDLRKTFEILHQDCARAEDVLGRARADYEQAKLLLNDTSFLECERIRPDCDTYLAGQVEPLCDRVGTYHGSLTRRDEDYHAMAAQLSQARNKARRLLDEYQTRLDRTTIEVRQCDEDLRKVEDGLAELAGNPALDFESPTAPIRLSISGWRAQVQRTMQSSLRDQSMTCQSGSAILSRARENYAALSTEATQIEAARRKAVAQVLEADRTINDAQLKLNTLPPGTGSRPGGNPLRSARQLLQQAKTCLQDLDHPAHRLALADVYRLLELAQTQANTALEDAREILNLPVTFNSTAGSYIPAVPPPPPGSAPDSGYWSYSPETGQYVWIRSSPRRPRK